MKKLILFALIFALSGCASKPVEIRCPAYPFGITLSARDVSETGLTLVCTQSDFTPRGKLQCGESYELEVYQNETWQPVSPTMCALPRADIVWHSIAYEIPLNDTVTWKIDWQYIYKTLPPGKYRICKEITDFVAPGDFDSHMFYAEFCIG